MLLLKYKVDLTFTTVIAKGPKIDACYFQENEKISVDDLDCVLIKNSL